MHFGARDNVAQQLVWSKTIPARVKLVIALAASRQGHHNLFDYLAQKEQDPTIQWAMWLSTAGKKTKRTTSYIFSAKLCTFIKCFAVRTVMASPLLSHCDIIRENVVFELMRIGCHCPQTAERL